MRCTQFGMWKSIGVMIILSYCQALKQEIGEECTNKNGIVGFCQFKNKCSKDTDLGAVCNSERTIICCSGNGLREKQHINSSSDKNEDQSVQSRFGFIPDFFHTPILPQNPTPNDNFFNHQQNLQFSNFVGNVLHQNLNTMQFVEDKPYQNIEQDVVTKPNKKKIIPTRPTNEYGYQSSNNNQKPNMKNIFNNDQSTKVPQSYYTPNYESSRPHQNQNSYNNYPNYQSSINYNHVNQRPNQSPTSNHNNRPNYEANQNYNNNNNNNHPSSTSPSLYPNQYTNYNQLNQATYETNQNYYPNSEPQRPNQNVNRRPYSESNQNNNNWPVTTQRPNYNQQINAYQPYHGPYQSNNNKFDTNPNYYTNTQKPQTNYNSGNYEYNSQLPNSQTNSNGYEGNKRPNQSTNTHLTSSSILFPDDSTDDKGSTKFTTTTKKYFEYQNGLNENKKRISEIKCEEYSKPLTTTISALPLSIDTAPKPISIEKCDSKSVGLIVGGTKAELGEFPHMVAIGFRTVSGNPWNCGGTLISERFVLTAAHCTHSALGNPVKVRLGELNLQKNNDGANPVDYIVEETIVHPNYVSTSKYNDIALLRLNKIVKFNNHIRPACLYNNNNIYSRKVTATGWGSIEYGERSSDDLLKVDLDVIENRRCNKLYEAESKTSTLNKGIIDSMVCAGDLAGGHDTCLGDSGGPLVIRSEKNVCIFNLIGITSFGKFCATENSPGVYTKVSSFLPWIEQIVWS